MSLAKRHEIWLAKYLAATGAVQERFVLQRQAVREASERQLVAASIRGFAEASMIMAHIPPMPPSYRREPWDASRPKRVSEWTGDN